MKIEIWSDFTCPFCYIGKKQLELAIEQFPYKEAITIEFISFPFGMDELAAKQMTAHDILMERHSLSADQFAIALEEVERKASEIDVCITFQNNEYMDTYKAHRLLKLAKKEQKDHIYVEKVFKSYFTKGLRIDENAILKEIALASGLELQAIEETLSLNCFAKAIEADLVLANEIGVNQLPFFVFEEKYAVVGAKDADVLLQVIYDVWQQEGWNEKRLKKAAVHEKIYCTGTECER